MPEYHNAPTNGRGNPEEDPRVTGPDDVDSNARIRALPPQPSARAAVVAIEEGRDRELAIREALGYGPHVEMLRQLVYWFSPRHPKMQNRWTLYKTFDEWWEECRLSDRQVKKGRKVLAAKGLIAHWRGQYGRPHYRVDWDALAEVLGLDFVPADGSEDPEDLEDAELLLNGADFNQDGISGGIETLNPRSNQDGISGPFNQDGISGPFNQDGISVRPNTEEYRRRIQAEDSPLQGGAEPAFAEPAPPKNELKKKIKDEPEPGEDFASRERALAPPQIGHEGRGFKEATPERKPTRQPEPPSVDEIVSMLEDKETEVGRIFECYSVGESGMGIGQIVTEITKELWAELGEPLYKGGSYSTLNPLAKEAVVTVIMARRGVETLVAQSEGVG